MKNTIAHFAPIMIEPCTGMGRIAWHWRTALLKRNWHFHEYGIEQVHFPMFRAHWPYSARRAWRKSRDNSNLLLAHEPSAEILRRTGVPTVLFSHGIEARGAKVTPRETEFESQGIRKFITYPLWRRVGIDTASALRNCPLLLLSNQEDRSEAMSVYNRRSEDIFVFRNGVNASSLEPNHISTDVPTVLFYASWLERKGKTLLVNSACMLHALGYNINWLLVGTGKTRDEVLLDWPTNLHQYIEVRPKVKSDEDDLIYSRATVFVLPSYFEGQPLTLLQAMESGRSVIASRCCGQMDVIRHGENGFLFEPGNYQELAHLIAQILDNDDIRLKTGARAKQDMKDRLWPRVAEEVVARLEHFLND